ncbi:asparaginase [Fusarium heterosporum]|uniref:Asparaginase n=1 Tax=Fusarium heterosporum TaxID=42747 RepID=A0A8H5SWK5_FUSHE|nr:asparaginase [Fusarium heterosporum]
MSDSRDDGASVDFGTAEFGTNGTFDRVLKAGHKTKVVPAIFVHAGAGFHSHQNEHIHLQACVAAAEMGMKFLKAGATATEAVEAALRILEDKEITNAGYGSNLSIDGTVECDATVVDHLGRSGACGAVPNIRNPISLAKLILDKSNIPLSLRRVPPNALVGEGARAFAEEHGLTIYANEYMVSKNAKDRYLRWQDDLKREKLKLRELTASPEAQGIVACPPCQYDTATTPKPHHSLASQDQRAAIMAGTWNEGQPNSPYVSTPSQEPVPSPDQPTSVSYFRATGPPTPTTNRPSSVRIAHDKSTPTYAGVVSATQETLRSASHTTILPQQSDSMAEDLKPDVRENTPNHQTNQPNIVNRIDRISPETSAGSTGYGSDHQSSSNPRGVKRPLSPDDKAQPHSRAGKDRLRYGSVSEDSITDTIGAIAIDDRGHIAAGSSSGGIGMKHRGRLGPAALVGVGTAVVPCDEEDEDQVAVAAVTSGTGEHMATTMASQRCAERVYHGTRRGRGGVNIQDDDEDAIMECFITEDFMKHPGVRNCHSAGAIGVMVVKKTQTGYYFYFAHNTDSFALASMGGSEKQASCTMSRLPDSANIAKGGRKVRIK